MRLKSTFKTTRNYMTGRAIFISNNKPYGRGFKQSQIRKLGLHQYEL